MRLGITWGSLAKYRPVEQFTSADDGDSCPRVVNSDRKTFRNNFIHLQFKQMYRT